MTSVTAAKRKSPPIKLIVVVLLISMIIGGVLGAFGLKILPTPTVHLPPANLLNAEHHFELTDNFNINIFKGFNLTNTLLSSWITTVVLLLVFGLAAAKRKLIPGRFQGFAEIIVETLYAFVESVVGKGYARRVFPVIATIFLFVLFNAWMGLLPLYFSFGYIDEGHRVAGLPLFTGGKIDATFLRPAGTDINMPLALGLASFITFEVWGFRVHGFSHLREFIRVDGFKQGAFIGIVQLFLIGPLELVSHFTRVVSFTFRLFGNMLAGEVLLVVITFMVPLTLALPFLGLELVVGVIQALVFAGLTLAFVGLSVASHGDHEQDAQHPKETAHSQAPAH